MVSQRQRLARKRFREAHPELFPKPEPTLPKDPDKKKKKKSKFKRKRSESRCAFLVHFGNAGGTKFAKCFICNKPGHLSKECPQNTHGTYPKGVCCKICGGVMHLAKDCPDKGKRINAGTEAIQTEERLTPKVTKFVSGDELDDDFMTENIYGNQNEKSSESKGSHAKPKK